jgi:hypothetical protein
MEDVDFGQRLCAAGGSVVQLPHRIRHVGAGGTSIPPERHRRLLLEGRLTFAACYYGRLLRGLLGSFVWPGDALRAFARVLP